jgi:hypothetical protein
VPYRRRSSKWPPIGSVTERILQFNNADRLIERQALIASGRYPPTAALRVM